MGETAASLELLKGSKKDAVDKELSAAPATEEEIELDIDIDSLDMASIDELVDQYSLEVPAEWSKLSLDQKKDWLRSQAEETPEPAAAPVEAKKPAKEKKAKAEKSKPDKPKPETFTEAEVSISHDGLEPAKADQLQEAVAKLTPADIEAAAKDIVTTDKKAKKEKSKAIAKSETLHGEIVDGDLIVDIVSEVETMNEQDARKTVAALNENTEKSYFKLGGVLSVILKNKWYEPYGHFRDLVENEYGIHYRKAMYWISIYDHLVESKVPWSKVKEIGWAKLKELADILTLDNVDQWVEVAKNNPQLKFLEIVKQAKQNDQPALADQSAQVSITTNKTFKVHSGQKETIEAAINKAKDECNTSVDTVALENICLDYLSGDSLKKRLVQMGPEKAANLVAEAFPGLNFTVDLSE